MVELTIDNLIKIIIGAVVIAVVILGIYFSFRNYIIPFFGGFGFGGNETGGGNGETLTDPCIKNGVWGTIGSLESDGFYPIIQNGEKTGFYIKGTEVYVKTVQPQIGKTLTNSAGRIIDSKINIDQIFKPRAGELDGKTVSGNNICNS